jgi:molybdopterin converting factor small subunit
MSAPESDRAPNRAKSRPLEPAQGSPADLRIGEPVAAIVLLPRSLVTLFPGAPRRIEVVGATVGGVIDALETRVPGMRDRLVMAGPALREHINVFVDGEHADLSTPIQPGSTIHVIPAVSGG